MEDQEQCLRMKQLCVDNGLPYWKTKTAFLYSSEHINSFEFYKGYFSIYFDSPFIKNEKTQVTEADFINLLKKYKNGK